MTSATITTPVGRLLSDINRSRTVDADGQPLLIKHGPNKGQPRQEYVIALAIPKGAETSWQQTAWGQQIVNVAMSEFPALFDPATRSLLPGREFAFKVVDGDSTIPNKKGNRPCDGEYNVGHWVLYWSNGFAPKTYNKDGTAPIDSATIKPGYFIQVNGIIKGNGSSQSPGIFLNGSLVALSGLGEEISFGADPSEAGFGQAALPAGARAVDTAPPAGIVPANDLVQQPPAPGAAVPPPVSAAVTPPPPAAPVEDKYTYNGVVYTKSQLLGFPGWTEAHLAALTKA